MNETAAPSPVSKPVPSISRRFKSAWQLEFSNFRWRLLICTLLARLLPEGRAMGLRTSLVRAIGLDIGAGTRFVGTPRIQSSRSGRLRPRLRIGSACVIGAHVTLEFGDVLTIGDRVRISDRVLILTTSHELGQKEHRAGPLVWSPVTIGNDVEIGEGAIILPGATLGDGACVLRDSVVNSKVAPGVTVSGIPARPLRPS